MSTQTGDHVKCVGINEGSEAMVEVEDGIKVWLRTWGNLNTGIPVLFVHGGPGNCVADYKDINEQFFDKTIFYVVEVDQRGTGKSQPSVRDDFRNMKKYLDISIDKMSADFEVVRKKLGIDKWLVFGGSWGSTLGLHYAETYPHRCLGLIIRGILLNTVEEFDAIYTQRPFEDNQRRLEEFKIFFDIAEKEALKHGEPTLDPNDSKRFVQLYEKMIVEGNKDAIWRFYVFENNIIEEDEENLLDPLTISEDLMPEATSVSFFEARLFLRGAFEQPLRLLEDVKKLQEGPVKTWVVQGLGDEICPEKYARDLVNSLKTVEGVLQKAHFVDAGHRASSDGVFSALQECVKDFLDGHQKNHQQTSK